MNGRRTDPARAVAWEMDHDAALDLVHVLGILEDFLRLASHEVVDELARFPVPGRSAARRLDVDALADYLGDQMVALRAATTTGTEPTTTGELP